MYCKSKMKQQTKFKTKNCNSIFFFFFLTSGQIWSSPITSATSWCQILFGRQCFLSWLTRGAVSGRVIIFFAFLLFVFDLFIFHPLNFLVIVLPSLCCALPLQLSFLKCSRVGFSEASVEGIDPCWVQGH